MSASHQKIKFTVRHETGKDVDAIREVTRAAFNGKSYSDGTEPLIIDRLREAKALFLSLVAELGDEIAGHVAFSKVLIDKNDIGWHGLGPISVLPKYQKQGIGSKLINEGLSKIKDMGGQGCVLEGSPIYYQRFGFKQYPGLTYTGSPDPAFFMALPFYVNVPKGEVEFHPAFYDLSNLQAGNHSG